MDQGNGGLTFAHDNEHADTELAFARLTDQGVSCSLKRVGLRLSPHAHVCEKEIDQVCSYLV